MDERNTWKLQYFYEKLTMYKGTRFCTNPFYFSKVVVISRRCSHIILSVYIVLAIVKTEVSFEIRSYAKGLIALNMSASQIHSVLCETSTIQTIKILGGSNI